MEKREWQAPIPIIRMFDVDAAKAFYVSFLGFTVDWEHRFEPDFPLYMQLSCSGCVLHLSEHHGDCSPGAAIRIGVTQIEELHKGLLAKNYKFARPGLEMAPWGMTELTVTDPSGNRLVFFEENNAD